MVQGPKRITAAEMIDLYESDNVVEPLLAPATDRRTVLEATMRIGEYFINHKTMADVDPVVFVAERSFLADAELNIIEPLRSRGHPAAAGVGILRDQTAIMQGMVHVCEYLLTHPDTANEKVVVEVEKCLVKVVTGVVGYLDGHPAAGRLAVSEEASEFCKRQRNRAEGRYRRANGIGSEGRDRDDKEEDEDEYESEGSSDMDMEED
ncbi:hypothetical protein K505DRAFT_357661 [Melanomma pulvis-pyrius CBS 109.77]|uniref:Uncharacterized protein n=1 Tax=Melanomma pulvis-pyrius CBS 109.77 TaxID=1314802 RepID=A0A6A6XQ37_9PLEO|nr:hypothetical protein K505DRAFT_357661 [Melanomma pulvis-pyrius CBS 109.77]